MEDPNADTQWNDALRRVGVLPQKEKAITEEEIINIVDNTVEEKIRKEAEKAIEDFSLEELELIEDEEDERVLLEYRQKRIAEMKEAASKDIFGDVRDISAADYVEQVNKAGSGIWVVLHLYKPAIPLCAMINNYMHTLARKFKDVKFLKSISDTCIEGYPDKNLPTLFIYYEGQLKEKFIGQEAFGNLAFKADELEWMLSEVGVLKTDLECNPRRPVQDVLLSSLRGNYDNDDNDW
ncbi:phosducin-like protein 3 [Parasteatoda tepidariorum]|uniref:phosducin-like protein 3 n=1 Tax=Parasteatoda tepidariorum TaxID=114398 RepID=UPI000A2C0693|nr:phosducin-like protein 3 [Parasteatoda tepidariorum]